MKSCHCKCCCGQSQRRDPLHLRVKGPHPGIDLPVEIVKPDRGVFFAPYREPVIGAIRKRSHADDIKTLEIKCLLFYGPEFRHENFYYRGECQVCLHHIEWATNRIEGFNDLHELEWRTLSHHYCPDREPGFYQMTAQACPSCKADTSMIAERICDDCRFGHWKDWSTREQFATDWPPSPPGAALVSDQLCETFGRAVGMPAELNLWKP